jgi:phosphate-selective porin OprO/OprP
MNSSNYNVFMERPTVVEAFNTNIRRFGACSYGVSEDQFWNWRGGVFMSQDVQNVGTALATPISEDYQAELAGRLASTLWYDEASDGRGYIHLGISGSYVSTDPAGGATSSARFNTPPEARTTTRWLDTGTIVGADDYYLIGVENVANFGPLQFTGEYQTVQVQRTNGADLDFLGTYVQVAYFLTGEHMPWDRKLGILARPKPFENFFRVWTCDDFIDGGLGAWQIAARYSFCDLTDDNVLGGEENNFTLGLNWWMNANARMQTNYIYADITDHAAVDGQTSGHAHIIGTRFQVDF